MKAWEVQDLPYYEHCAIVFAETAGKAKKYCVDHEDVIGEVEFIKVYVRRAKEMDKYYTGKCGMDWHDEDDRIAMVKEMGFYCDDEGFDPTECKTCTANKFCSKYQDWLDEYAASGVGQTFSP